MSSSPVDDTESSSPTDSRQFEPMRTGNEQSGDSSARRARPAASSGRGYGTISNDNPPERQAGAGDRSRLLTRNPSSSADTTATTRPRQPSRRSSSKYQTPHRGQEFSADDDLLDVQSDAQKAKLKRSGSQTLRRRATGPITLSKIDSTEEEDELGQRPGPSKGAPVPLEDATTDDNDEANEDEEEESPGTDTTAQPGDEDGDGEGDDEDLSDAESFTLKDRQAAINQTHPFGIRIWKPALYKKNRSVEKTAEGDIHSTPGGHVSNWIWLFNIVWTLVFGWWLAFFALGGALVCVVVGALSGDLEYGQVLWGLSGYIFYPFGKFVKLRQDEAYADEDEGEGRSISEYEQWQSGDIEDGRLFFGPSTSSSHSRSLVGRRRESLDSADENDSLLSYSRTGGPPRTETHQTKRRLFGRGQWTVGRVTFYIIFYAFIGPLMLVVSGLCWFMVFWIPMGRVTAILWTHLRRHPLALSFHRDASFARSPTDGPASILLCTYRAVGTKYWKYTIDGTNIFLINLLAVVVFTIVDYFVFAEWLELEIWLTNTGLVFTLALFSIMPLAYFIGQAVASISAQSSMGLGAAINAFFSTLVEVFLYCVALNQGKGQLVEGSIVGSLFAGLLLLPGLSMCFGAIQRKTQRFNVRSAGVTSTMLLFAVIAAFGPTLFYKIYGSHELTCRACSRAHHGENEDCRECFYSQTPAITDRFFVEAVRPYCWFAAIMLFLSYIIGLLFTLRTHAAVIWNEAPEDRKVHSSMVLPNNTLGQSIPSIAPRLEEEREHGRGRNESAVATTGRSQVRDDHLYQRILAQSMKQIGLEQSVDSLASKPTQKDQEDATAAAVDRQSSTHLVPPKEPEIEGLKPIQGLSDEQHSQLVKQMAQMAATAVAFAARDTSLRSRRSRLPSHIGSKTGGHTPAVGAQDSILVEQPRHAPAAPVDHQIHAEAGAAGGGHDAPNWGTLKSYAVLLGATLLYAIIAEILVNTVDVVLQGDSSFSVDEKFLGITLFSLVPNTTEFLNAISFAMNGNIALSMEIGSAYALQVCLLQIPALVLFSAVRGEFAGDRNLAAHTFNLIFPEWDMVTVILCVFLLSYVYGEGKSNYFKGSILVLTYFVILVGFWQAGTSTAMDFAGFDRFETTGLAGSVSKTYKTIGRFSNGKAY